VYAEDTDFDSPRSRDGIPYYTYPVDLDLGYWHVPARHRGTARTQIITIQVEEP